MSSPRLRGIVRHWNAARHFGKIAGPGRETFFVHGEDLIDVMALRPGQRVRFEAADSARGPRAVNVRPIEEA